ncbi:alpha-glucosidase [Pseudonocardia endophytica]|uniref:Alpha-glucosidase n=1 Tax=Pseudonocardia endophytica TaxID=401976 RepID=A0A4R1HVR6_PSEEN|nr:alpha-glucosidase [Pseudonocardia endophytica]
MVYAVDVRAFTEQGLDGVRERLGYLELLDVDAVALGPSAVCGPGGEPPAPPDPLARLTDRARAAGLRVLTGLAPGHVTTDHEWFREALHSDPGSAARERLHVRRGRGPSGSLPPTGWRDLAGGPAWSRLGSGEDWYLHLPGPGLPDVNWADPEVWAETEKAIRSWCDRGVDGLWIDGAHLLSPRPSFDEDPRPDERGPLSEPDDPRTDLPGVHEAHRTVRAVLDHYPGRIAAAGVDVADPERFAAYGRPDELHLAVQQGLRYVPFDAGRIREVVDGSLRATRASGATPGWSLCRPGDARAATRFGGRDRARAMALLLLALPGTAVLDAGEELCLPGWGTPVPGVAREPFAWAEAQTQLEDPTSALSLHRRALELRRTHPGFTSVAGTDELEWFGAPDGCLAFRRPGSSLVCALNTSAAPVPLPPGELLISSRSAPVDVLPAYSSAWLT